jgi:hypothetical protein
MEGTVLQGCCKSLTVTDCYVFNVLWTMDCDTLISVR